MEADRERMKTLLVEAIATLCRNGLKYTDELSVEGLIGITLDKKDVFLVSVRETYSLTSQFNQNGSESPQSQDSVGSEKVQKRSTKRSRENNGEGGPNEKHKRKGAPKKIGAHEAELINNSPAGDDLVDSLDDEDSSSFGSRIPRKREEEFVVIEDFEDDVPIKKETVISQGSDYMTSPETASSFAQMPSQNNPPKPVMASTHTVSRAPPPLHPRPDQVSPRAADQMDIRFQHPAGVSNDQLILAQDIKVEHDSDSSMSVYRSPSGEIIKVPRNMNAESNIPVTVSVMAGVGGTQSVQGMHDTSGGPDDWATPSSSQEFITLPGSDSLQESPSQQAPGSSGASQQGDDQGYAVYRRAAGAAPQYMKSNPLPHDEMTRYYKTSLPLGNYQCNLCSKRFRMKHGLQQHLRSKHWGIFFPCSYCGRRFTRQTLLRNHITTAHNFSRAGSLVSTHFTGPVLPGLHLDTIPQFPVPSQLPTEGPKPRVETEQHSVLQEGKNSQAQGDGSMLDLCISGVRAAADRQAPMCQATSANPAAGFVRTGETTLKADVKDSGHGVEIPESTATHCEEESSD